MNGLRAIPLKSSCVTYAAAGRKTLAVSRIARDFRFDGRMSDPIWAEAAKAEDFVPYDREPDPAGERKSIFRTFRTDDELLIGWFFANPPEARLRPAAGNGVTVWSGDLAELHFGAVAPDPWMLQLCIGITGLIFDSTGEDRCGYEVFENDEGWGGAVRIPLALLPASDGGIGFNLCRCDMRDGRFSTWNPLLLRFHETENFGELLLTDYASAARLRGWTGAKFPATREAFEALRREMEIPAAAVTHGPYLSAPDQDGVCVNWTTAGMVPAFLEYRAKGSDAPPRRVNCSPVNGILVSETAHFAHITGLKPETDYEYRLFSLTPVLNEPAPGMTGYFRSAPAPGREYSFFCVSDIHSNAAFLQHAMNSPEAGEAAFHLLLGDSLSSAAGREAICTGVIDPVVEANRRRGRDIPLVFARGNHEQIGIFAAEYFNVMRHPSGRTWYAFRCGDVLFTVLDTGGEPWAYAPENPMYCNNEMAEEEREFLEELTASDAWRDAPFRIVFAHIPPLEAFAPQYRLTAPLRKCGTPPDLVVSGHTHRYGRIDRLAEAFTAESDPVMAGRHPHPAPAPYTRLILATDTAVHCRVRPGGLEIAVLKFASDSRSAVSDRFTLPGR